MARSRMIRPEFWDDEKLATIPIEARLVFIGLWNHSDDYGVVKGNVIWLRNHVLPYEDSLSPHVFQSWLDDIEKIGCILSFSHNGEKYYYIKNFNVYQKVNRPSKQRYPKPPHNILSECSVSPHGLSAHARTYTRKTETETETEEKPPPSSGQTFKPISSKKNIPKKGTPGKAPGIDLKKKNNVKNQDFTENLSDVFLKINQDCDAILSLPKDSKRKESFDPRKWAQKQINSSKHPGAVSRAIGGLKLYWGQSRDPWSYLDTILAKVNGNFNEQESIAIHEDLKNNYDSNQLSKLTAGLIKGF